MLQHINEPLDIEMKYLPANCNPACPNAASLSLSVSPDVLSDASSEISDSKMCRYCFSVVDDNHSICSCRTALCKACLERELCLTEGRQDHVLKCTVCQTRYDISYLHSVESSCCHQFLFVLKETLFWRNLQIQGTRVPSIRERLALLLLMAFLSLWTAATTYSIVDPGVSDFNGLSAELLVYLFLVFMDFCVGFSMIWFVKLVDTLQLTLPFVLSLLHVARSVLVLVLKLIVIRPQGDGWKIVGSAGTLMTSLCVIVSCFKMYLVTAKEGYRRLQMRNVQIMVGGKGPFRLRDIDRYVQSSQLQDGDVEADGSELENDDRSQPPQSPLSQGNRREDGNEDLSERRQILEIISVENEA